MLPKKTHKDLEVLTFSTYRKWLNWLDQNFEQHQSIWLKLAKKTSGVQSITYEEAREGAIVYGWIDGLINRFDERYYLIKFTPRRPKSNWSKINRGIAEQLIANKMMKPSGLAQVHAAQADGRWEAAYDSSSSIEVPNELKKLLKTDSVAQENFNNLNQANRYAFLYRIQNAKRETTKQKHILRAFEMCRRGEVYHPATRSTKTIKKKK
ncbi:MAG: YdeI/OmpD-associated family protein [Planctomycetota bacterium]